MVGWGGEASGVCGLGYREGCELAACCWLDQILLGVVWMGEGLVDGPFGASAGMARQREIRERVADEWVAGGVDGE